jgi:hypothetical protein
MEVIKAIKFSDYGIINFLIVLHNQNNNLRIVYYFGFLDAYTYNFTLSRNIWFIFFYFITQKSTRKMNSEGRSL